SSDDRMKASIAEARASLPEAKRATFDTALQVLFFSGLSFGDLLHQGAAPGVGGIETRVKEALNGKSASDVIAAADSVRKQQEAKEREQALQEIRELEEKKSAVDGARQELAKFVVVRSRFYQSHNALGMTEPIIELTVKNGTTSAVSRAYFVGT